MGGLIISHSNLPIPTAKPSGFFCSIAFQLFNSKVFLFLLTMANSPASGGAIRYARQSFSHNFPAGHISILGDCQYGYCTHKKQYNQQADKAKLFKSHNVLLSLFCDIINFAAPGTGQQHVRLLRRQPCRSILCHPILSVCKRCPHQD